ncbi:MAG TPA: undecaprenyldiphospho-muramoylpentapeptide beta-N-acetylglucosaminyltransferase [Saprospiraceae bacterium]|nr:undecaprenyldiphospho-muramoylpentapeptide beta-N-acetylglucosaminyltransferase [Saprospiraceae bacterium]
MKVIIAGGGTGGHVFPAIAIANAIIAKDPSVEILFVGAQGKLEMEKVPIAGYNIIGLWISGLQRKLTIKNLMFPVKLLSSLIKSRRIIKSFKPDVVVGVGGYASGPILKAANHFKIPTIIQEQNSFAGITNRLLAQEASVICVAYEGMERFFPQAKIILTGNPLRSDVSIIAGKRSKAIEYFGLQDNKKTLAILGGSGGALSINNALSDAYEIISNLDNIQVIWQCGQAYFERFKVSKLATLGNVHIMPFTDRIDYVYACADVIVARAGALTVSELSLIAKPVILVPSPNVAEDHQTKNAMSLVRKNAAILVPDLEAKNVLIKRSIELLNNTDQCISLSEEIRKFAKPNASSDIAEIVLKEGNRNR